MEKIIVGLSKHKGFAPGSKIIQICEGTNFSHAYVKIESTSLERILIYQATGSGVNFIGLDKFEEHNQPMKEFVFEISSEAKKLGLQFAIDACGTQYSRLQLIGIALKRVARLFGFKIKNPISSSGYICTELVSKFLNEVGLFDDSVDLNDIGLIELQSILESKK